MSRMKAFPGLAALDRQVMSGQQGLDSLKAGRRSGQGEKREDLIDAAKVRAGRHETRSQEALDFRGKEKPFAIRTPLPRPIERADAEAVAGEK